ncbi:class I SAM-dependent methyltransferase [Flagellimonas meridianipacifica]|nr:methyltransferase domain-containing protein [Allomuricauda pacifica]
MFQKPEDYEIRRKIKDKKKELIKLFQLEGDEKSLSEKKFLDFGAGTGIAYKAAKELGMECFYQDLDNEAKKFTIENFGLQSTHIIDNIDDFDEKFDFIFSDNVIEHVKDPKAFLEKLLKKLNKGGVLIIKTPHSANTETYFNPMISVVKYFFLSLKYNSFGKTVRGFFLRFWHCDPPRHLYSFSKDSFDCLVENSEDKEINHRIEYYRSAWFSNTITKRFFTRDKKASLVKSILVRIVVWPVIFVEVILQILQKLLLSLQVLSPGGIILKVYK